ncbi:MAG TPA: hypothetical protein EYG40_11520 [Verrucomicrobia bacterium]|nr:hypothetical protein [Verrucomicrobiota bacterium]
MIIARGLVALFLIPLVGLLHFLLATQFEIYEHRPIWGAVVVLASLIVLGRLLMRATNNHKTLTVLNLLGWVLALALFWWIEVFTHYPPLKVNHKLGQKINWSNGENLQDSQGNSFNIDSQLNKTNQTLLVFYRGHW